jgi:hypothetical protein
MPKNEKSADLAAAAEEAAEPDGPPAVEYDGKTYTIDTDASGDVELIEALAELDEGNQLVLPRVVRSLVGEDQYAAFKEAVRDPETGRVPMASLRDFFRQIDAALGE